LEVNRLLDFDYNYKKVIVQKSDQNDTEKEISNEREDHFNGIIGNSEQIKNIFKLIEKVSYSDSTILINGKSGTGKELVAKAIHQSSKRKDRPFIALNCGAIPENLMESELFGHVKGAFTGATNQKIGKFELANGGTIFLDEIGDMSPDLQVKLLRVLEEKEFERVGGLKIIKTDVRIIAATHRNLREEVKEGRFREDLYYRLYVIPIKLPPLMDRKADIPILISYFIKQFNSINNSNVEGITDNALKVMMEYAWPGNVRELKNFIERLVVLKRDGQITSSDLKETIFYTSKSITQNIIDISNDGICLSSAVNEFERALIFQSLEKTKWVKNRAAKLLKLKRTTLVEKIKRYQIKPDSSMNAVAV
jgi:sigma-54 specific flagellar transcriptional regulator A